jgi:hypothetical protein
LFNFDEVMLLVDCRYAEAVEALKARAAVSASTPEFIYGLGYTGCGKLRSFLYAYIHIIKDVSLPHPVLIWSLGFETGSVNVSIRSRLLWF